jgi:hypothetical protein
MMKNCLLAVALLSLALASGCAKGGNGAVPLPVTITVTANDVSANAIYPTQSVTLAANVTNSSNTAVTWSLSGAGTLTPVSPPPAPPAAATAIYVAPTTVPTAASQPTVTATLVGDSSVKGTLAMTVIDVTTDVAPAPATLNVGSGLTQQFTAVAVPDNAATQSFTWTCSTTVNGTVTGSCASFSPDPNVSSLAYYTAQDSCSGVGCIQISAASTLDPAGCTPNPKYCTVAKASLVASRVSGTYAFRFSGYDSSNNATAVVGTFTAANGTITSGVEDVLTANGPSPQPIQITGGSYTPTSSDPNNSNNAGKLTLTLPTGVYPNQYQVVLNGAGDLKMIETDGNGTGSGVAQISSNPNLLKGAQTYAFGFTGVDSGGYRVGYVGLLSTDGAGNINGGSMDVNDNGHSSNSICGTPPCAIAGTYKSNGNGSWHLALTSPVTMNFDFYIASGTASKTNPLTFYAISTDPAANPAVSGTMVLQDSSQTYNNAAFNGTSVSALTGTVANGVNGCAVPLGCANVSLTLGSTDGKGNFSGLFDQNNAGVILSSVQFPPTTGANNYTYAASGTNGRYTFNMLGNPTTTPVGAPLPFVLYASGANRGFLLDQKSSSVMAGTMNPQGNGSGLFGGSTLPGTYAAATTHSGNSGVDPIAANLLLTWTNSALNTGACTAECVNGTQYDTVNYSLTSVPLAGAYTIHDIGNGTIVLTAPSAQNYAIYVLDTSGCSSDQDPVCAIQDFLMMDEDKTNPNPSIIFAQQ